MVQLFFSGALTTTCFTLMMQISYMATESIQATHFSLLATCEVFGKLLLQPLVSMFTDHYGYEAAFVLFSFLYFVCYFIYKFHPSCLTSSINSNTKVSLSSKKIN